VTTLFYHIKNLFFLLMGIILIVGGMGCEKDVPISAFEFEYEPEYKIEADFYPANLGKSVLRVDRTFTIEDTMSIREAHIRDASAEIRTEEGALLSSFSWHDSAAAYSYIAEEGDGPFGNGFGVGADVDTLYYGAYRLDNLNFELSDNQRYRVNVTIDGEGFTTTFRPYPAVTFFPFKTDMIVRRENQSRRGTHEVIYATMAADTAKLQWAEDPEAYFYSVYITRLGYGTSVMPRVFTFPGPALDIGAVPGTYDIIIGSLSETFYKHYYLRDFPPNHEARNFFGGKALGYAGAINERYLRIQIVAGEE